MIRPSVPADALELAPRLRTADVTEISVLSGMEPLEALSHGFLNSSSCMTGIGKCGGIVGMFGVVPWPAGDREGLVWFLSSDRISENKREIIVGGRTWIEAQLAHYNILHNVVSTHNTVHINLIEHLGFTFGGRTLVGGAEVLPFHRRRA